MYDGQWNRAADAIGEPGLRKLVAKAGDYVMGLPVDELAKEATLYGINPAISEFERTASSPKTATLATGLEDPDEVPATAEERRAILGTYRPGPSSVVSPDKPEPTPVAAIAADACEALSTSAADSRVQPSDELQEVP